MAGVVHFKAIKPSKMQYDVFRQMARNAMRRVSYGMKKDFEKTTATWEHEVTFLEHTAASSRDDFIASEVSTNDDVWVMLNGGTKRHPIFAGFYTGKSDKKFLAFPSAFSPKTTPGVIGSAPGMTGGPTVYTPYVDHPGTKAREWTKVIEKQWKPRFKAEISQMFKDFRQASGRAM